MGSPAQRKWLDPRIYLSPRARAYLEESPEFAAVFAELDRCGPARPPTLQAAVRIARLTRSTFRRQFGNLAGRPWRDFIGRWRMDCARDYLTVPFASEKEIARRCGFGSTSAFSRAFREQCGKTPREFRESLEPGDTKSLDEELAAV